MSGWQSDAVLQLLYQDRSGVSDLGFNRCRDFYHRSISAAQLGDASCALVSPDPGWYGENGSFDLVLGECGAPALGRLLLGDVDARGCGAHRHQHFLGLGRSFDAPVSVVARVERGGLLVYGVGVRFADLPGHGSDAPARDCGPRLHPRLAVSHHWDGDGDEFTAVGPIAVGYATSN